MSLKKLVSVVCVGLALALVACDAGDKGYAKSTAGLDEVKKLHRGELSAIATYEDVIKKNDTPAWGADLARILDDHRDAADRLRARVTALGGTPDASAGPWGGWAELVAKGAAAIGDDAGRAALKAGENHGINEYEEALKDVDVDADTKALARTLLERQREHVRTLDGLKKEAQ